MKSWRLRWARHVIQIKERSSAYKILVGKLLGKWPLGKLRDGKIQEG
jgi:hypothetical protein